MFENTPSDKLQFRALGELPAPGTCIVCGSGTAEDGYVDLGIYVDYVGEVLICTTCLTQAGELVGMMLKDEVAHIQHTADVLLADNIVLKKDLKDRDERLKAFNLLFDGPRNLPDSAGGLSLKDFSGDESGIVNSGTAGKSESEESVTVEGFKLPGKTAKGNDPEVGSLQL